MSAIWTKICGITRAEDAEAVAGMGADAVGFVLYPGSKRAVSVADCAELTASIVSPVRRVGLFVNPDIELVQQAVAEAGLDLLQFHGEEAESFCSLFGVPYMKAIRVRNLEQAEQEIAKYSSAEMILLDSYQENVPGGTGKTFDWSAAADLVSTSSQPVVLAGGLNAGNVKAAIEQVRPFGVDVSSGVESSPGHKDLVAVRQFIKSSKSV